MNGLNQIDQLDHAPSQHSEITLGTSTLLGIFLGLVLVCSVFFGFGYSLGRRSIQASTGADATSDSANFGTFKPSPGNAAAPAEARAEPSAPPASSARAAAAELADANSDSASGAAQPTTAKAPAATDASKSAASPTDKIAPLPTRSASAIPAPLPAAPSSNVASQLAQPAVPLMVQIAAVSHQEDADVLVKALKRQGHDVVAKQDPTDRLIHVQLGPFNNRKDAEAVRQTLLTEGYNAIVK